MSANIIQHVIDGPDDENNYYEPYDQNDDDYYEPYDQDDDVDKSNYIYIVNTILSGTARLNILLPTATILAFTIFAPLLTNDGKCTTLDRWLMGFFLSMLASSCVFFSLTDSFRTATGRLYYGVATFHGIRTFDGGRTRPCVLSDYRLRFSDIFHASLSLIAFLTFAMLHNDVLSCYHLVLQRKVTNIVPLVVGFLISVLFVLFPSRRRGIGYPFLLHTDALYSRN
ncbi:hypothetical protein BUALT_Bualt08G0129900 [Buddleja alternifolia]|uniref:Uncharacterized protein n=1 Tax=Buddleja alternifolia TaxID=168488 RepID=A0AAV6X9V6_9LAMI|nr:hypothetical protein BUALT_Bualt08G0129900 [Buddleja alternifolia]